LGKYVLLSDCFAYWGKESKVISEGLLDILPKHQENKYYQGDSDNGAKIMKEVDKLYKWNFKNIIENEPHEYMRNHSHKGC
jgi:hypothetical protein